MSALHHWTARRAAVCGVASLALALTGCGGGGSEDSDAGLTVWVQEDLPDRVAATKEIVAGFTEQSGTKVKVVAVAEDQFNELLTSSAAAGDLPDVIGGISLPQVRTLSANELIDTEAVAAVRKDLGTDTFSEPALDLTSDGNTALAIPSESWLQILVYRSDLFKKAGLEPPTTYDAIRAAAKKLDSQDMAGFVGANKPGDAFTEQTFEHLALANDCEMVDDQGDVQLDSPECVDSFDFYGDLLQNYSVPGAQDVDTVRASYFAGDAAMMIWSTFVLDEMAGLRKDALPTCDPCQGNPAFLAENSGIVTGLQGPSGDEPALFGEITSWTITAEANTEPAKAFVKYMMSDGYLPWIEIAPEGKVPVRTGTADSPDKYTEAWSKMEVGVDKKAPLSKFYGQDVLDALANGPEQLSRWAIPQDQGALIGATQGEHPVAQAVNEVTTGTDAQEAAKNAAESVRSIAESVS